MNDLRNVSNDRLRQIEFDARWTLDPPSLREVVREEITRDLNNA